jgi:hypothetical protein
MRSAARAIAGFGSARILGQLARGDEQLAEAVACRGVGRWALGFGGAGRSRVAFSPRLLHRSLEVVRRGHEHTQARVEAAAGGGHVGDAQGEVVGRARGGHGQDPVAVGDGQHAEDAADVLGQYA